MYVFNNEVLSRIAYHERLKINEDGLYYRLSDNPDAKGSTNFHFLTNDPVEVCTLFGIDGQAYTNQNATNIETFKLLQQSPYVINRHYRYVNELSSEYMKSFTAYMKAYPLDPNKPRVRITLDEIDKVFPYIRIKHIVEHYEFVVGNQAKIGRTTGEVFKYLVATGFDKTRYSEGLEKLYGCFASSWETKYFLLTKSNKEVGDFIRQQLD